MSKKIAIIAAAAIISLVVLFALSVKIAATIIGNGDAVLTSKEGVGLI
jgi:predicted RecA/RadA family phage recombinase